MRLTGSAARSDWRQETAESVISLLFRTKQIRLQERTPDVDISEVELVRIEQKEVAKAQKLDLTTGEVVTLAPTTSVGTAIPRDRHKALLADIIARLNEQFGGEFRDEQIASFMEGGVGVMKTDPTLRQQVSANSLDQFRASSSVRRTAILALHEMVQAHTDMVGLTQRDSRTEKMLVDLILELLYSDLNEEEDPIGTEEASSEREAAGR